MASGVMPRKGKKTTSYEAWWMDGRNRLWKRFKTSDEAEAFVAVYEAIETAKRYRVVWAEMLDWMTRNA